MKRIKTWRERCEEHPDHQQGMISERMIQERMQEEIEDLRAALAQPDEKFCDANCVWTDHHPDCALAKEPLTDQEIIEAIKHISHNEMSAFAIARAIESVLKNASSEANKGTYDNP